ncbi:MAG: hypothetical protein RJB34_1853 [Pseudomonadota bacterium]|jgi:PKD repeat protein
MEFFQNFVKCGLIVSIFGVLVSCGGGGGGSSGNSLGNTRPTMQVTVQSSYNAGVEVIPVSATGIVEIALDVFTMPVAQAMAVGKIFIYDGIAYKVSAINPATDGANRNQINTTQPTPEEVFSTLKIQGRVPLDASTTASPNALAARASALAVGVERLSPASSPPTTSKTWTRLKDWLKKEGFNDADCSAVTAASESVPLGTTSLQLGVKSALTCVVTGNGLGGSTVITSTTTVEALGHIDIDYDIKNSGKAKFDVHLEVSPDTSVTFAQAWGKDWRKNLHTFYIPIPDPVTGGTLFQMIVPIDFIAGYQADIAGTVKFGLSAYVDASYTYEKALPYAQHTKTLTGGLRSTSSIKGDAGITGYVGISPGVGLAALGIKLASVNLDGKILAEGNATSESSSGCANFSIKLGLGLTAVDLFGTDHSIASWVSPNPLWPNSGQICAATPIAIVTTGSQTIGDTLIIPISPLRGRAVTASSSKTFGFGVAGITWNRISGDMLLNFGSPTTADTQINASNTLGAQATLRLDVINLANRTGSKIFTVKRNQRPIALGTAKVANNVLTLDASASTDPDGKVSVYEWTLSDGRVIASVNPISTFSATGWTRPVVVTLKVTDDLGDSNITAVQISESNTPPTAAITPLTGNLYAGAAIAFSGAGSTDTEGSIVTYAWDFGDGTTALGVNSTHKYSVAGTYTVTLVVTDNSGAKSSAKQVVNIANDPNSTQTRLVDDFNGTILDSTKWTLTAGTAVMGDNGVTLECFGTIDTKDKVIFSGNKIVLETAFTGIGNPASQWRPYSTAFYLIDIATGSRISFGDTNYFHGSGFYFEGTDFFQIWQTFVSSATRERKEYRMTLDGNAVILARGDTLDSLDESRTFILPNSINGRSFYLLIGSGGPDYCNSHIDWVRVSTK